MEINNLNNLENGPIMIRRDGEVFTNIIFHPYTTDGPDYTIEYLEWIYNSTDDTITKSLIVDFLSALCQENELGFELRDLYRYYEAPQPSEYFIRIVQPLLRVTSSDIEELNNKIGQRVNQEFLRARLGGRYDTSHEDEGEIVFRVASVNEDWYDIIRNFIQNNLATIKFVTIIHDKETFRDNTPYMLNGKNIVKMPVDEFLESGKILIEKETL